MEPVTGKPLSLRALVWIYCKAGNTTFGGGDPTMAVLRRELGEQRGWLSEEQFALAYSLARITPGTNILAFCVATAYMLHGWAASVAAVVAASAPSALVAVWLTVVYEASVRHPVAQATISAVLAAVVGMVAASVLQLLKPNMSGTGWLRILVVTGGTLALREGPQWTPLQIMAVAVVIGAFWRESGSK